MFKGEQCQRYGQDDGSHDLQVWALEEVGDTYWCGTNEGLIWHRPRLGFLGWTKPLTEEDGLPNKHVRFIKKGYDNRLWFGTWGGGPGWTPNRATSAPILS